MYGLPSDYDGKRFVARVLENVSFTENYVCFGFDNDLLVTLHSSLQHQRGAGEENAAIQSVPIAESQLMELLGHSVTQVRGENDGTLAIFFDNGGVLRLFDDSKQYESYIINDQGHEIIV